MKALILDMIGVTGVLATCTGFASCTSAFSSSSIKDSSSDSSDISAEVTIARCSGTGRPRLLREARELTDVPRESVSFAWWSLSTFRDLASNAPICDEATSFGFSA